MLSLKSPNDKSEMRLYIMRNIIYGCVLFLFLTVVRVLNPVQLASLDSAEHSNLQRKNPRFKRSLKHDGPIVDLGPGDSAQWASDLFISVKTSQKFHDSRLRDIVDTWFRLRPENIYFFTDNSDKALIEETGGHLINSNCSASHSRQALCCKMGVELDTFLVSDKRWFCHFDDDNYVNVPQLMRLLAKFDPRKDWYIGRPSTRGPIEILDRNEQTPSKISFWFATGGAGFCLSRSLVTKMAPYVANGKFLSLGDTIRLPDDVTVGYLIEHLLGKRLTVVDKFHSHLESMKLINLDNIHEQVSLSAGSYSSNRKNVVRVKNIFSEASDPNRFRSLHCFLFPKAHICPTESTTSSFR